jgi:hypothetical protein
MPDTYRKIAIGSIERLPVTARTPAGAMIDLSAILVTVRVLGPGAGGGLVVTDAVCVTSATGAYYDWDTTGLAAGRYFVQFTFDFGDLYSIQPADPLSVILESRLGGA